MSLPKKEHYTSKDYFNLSDGDRAELIDGDLYYMTPPSRIHQRIVSQLTKTISNYIDSNQGSCQVYPAPFAVNLNADDKTYVEPDISVICDPNKLTDRGCSGAPDWIIEIVSPSSVAMDYYKKLFKYRSAGVHEYWIINPLKNTILVYDFENDDGIGQYTFEDTIDVRIYKSLQITLSELL